MPFRIYLNKKYLIHTKYYSQQKIITKLKFNGYGGRSYNDINMLLNKVSP
jgi:hypothetical protein